MTPGLGKFSSCLHVDARQFMVLHYSALAKSIKGAFLQSVIILFYTEQKHYYTYDK